MLMLTCTVDIMVLEDTVDMVDIMDIDIMESALLMLSPRLTPTFCMEDMDTLDTPDTMDTPMLLTVITDKLFPLVLWRIWTPWIRRTLWIPLCCLQLLRISYSPWYYGQPTILVFFISDHIFSA